MPGVASAATAVAIGLRRRRHLDHPRRRRRHHAAQPRAADDRRAVRHPGRAAIPGRIDLGVGRAPGTDQLTAHALRRTLQGDVDAFPQDVVELMGYFRAAEPGQAVRAVPGAGLDVPVWILGSSLFGAQLAADPRPALRLRLALRAGRDDAGGRDLPRAVRAVGRSWPSPM